MPALRVGSGARQSAAPALYARLPTPDAHRDERQLLHGAQHRCCVSDPAEEQMHTRTPGATVISILGDSLSSTEGRCQAYRPWPMLLQDSLGTQAFTVHGFALPGVAASGYRR